MTSIQKVQLQNTSPSAFTVSDGSNTYTLSGATPGHPGTLDLQIQIADYTIRNGPLQVGSVRLSADATVTLSPGNGGLNSPISVVTTIAPY